MSESDKSLMCQLNWAKGRDFPENKDRLLEVYDVLEAEIPLYQGIRVYNETNREASYLDEALINPIYAGLCEKAGDWELPKEILTRPFEIADFLFQKLRENEIQLAFAPIRPPGHHSSKDKIGTFSGLNYAGLLAERYSTNYKIGIIDLDTHYSGGTEEIVGGNENIILLDFFTALFDKTQPDFQNITKIPIGTRKDFLNQFQERLPLVEGSDFLIVSLGFDMLQGEKDGPDLKYSDVSWIAQKIKKLKIPTLFVLEGGYQMESLRKGTSNLLSGLLSDA